IAGEAARAAVSRAITARGWTILELAGDAPSLEEVFLRLVEGGREERGAHGAPGTGPRSATAPSGPSGGGTA
ncbi:MAG: hypothetical protein ACKO2K_14050, partial [Alphaproteobacteria bacterium]